MLDSIDFGSTGLAINGEANGFPVMVRRLQLVMPLPRGARLRQAQTEKHEVHTWDEHGVKAFARRGERYVEWFAVFRSRSDPQRHPNDPRRPHEGAITVEGTPIEQIEFRVGYQGLQLATTGPFLINRTFGTAQGDHYEFSIAARGFDYFATGA